MIKATDFKGFTQTVNMATSSIRDKVVRINAVIDIAEGKVAYVVTDSNGKSDEYNSLEGAVIMYNKVAGGDYEN